MKRLTTILMSILIISAVAVAQDKKTNTNPQKDKTPAKGDPSAIVPTKMPKTATYPITIASTPAKTKSARDTAARKSSGKK